jgi:AraC-like DNA-binding protein
MTDEILELLDLMRVRGTACVGESLTAPWKVCVDENPDLARFHLVLAGRTWISMDGASDGIQLFPGDIVIIPNGKAHCYFDRKERGVPSEATMLNGHAKISQTEPSPNTHMFCGYFQFSENTPPAIISRLPDMLVERGGEGRRARKFNLLVQLINAEIGRQSEPLQSVLNRLTEILCLHAIQNWLKHALSHDEALQALASPRIKEVIDRIHSEPTASWTVDSLARVYGQSRTAFAAHFKFATGQSPINYVRQYRIKQACTMLEETALSVDDVAYNSGYADTNAFNRAFRRETGASPGAYRRMPRL